MAIEIYDVVIQPTLLIKCNKGGCLPCSRLSYDVRYYNVPFNERKWRCTLFDNEELNNDTQGLPQRLVQCKEAELNAWGPK